MYVFVKAMIEFLTEKECLNPQMNYNLFKYYMRYRGVRYCKRASSVDSKTVSGV